MIPHFPRKRYLLRPKCTTPTQIYTLVHFRLPHRVTGNLEGSKEQTFFQKHPQLLLDLWLHSPLSRVGNARHLAPTKLVLRTETPPAFVRPLVTHSAVTSWNPSLISPMVSEDVKHHVYLLYVMAVSGEPVWPSGKALGSRFDTASALISFQKGCGLGTLSCDCVHHFLLKH